MKISIISGSHRQNSQSEKVSRFVSHLLSNEWQVENEIINLAGNPLPLWDDSFWRADSELRKQFAPYSDKLKKSDALIVVTPEWAGMVAAGLKNFFLYCGPQELGHKPALIVTVSSSRGGSYPVAELRMSSYKNAFLCYIPDHVILRQVEAVLNDPLKSTSPDDDYIRGRLKYSLRMLQEYARALSLVRASGVPDYKTYPFGM